MWSMYRNRKKMAVFAVLLAAATIFPAFSGGTEESVSGEETAQTAEDTGSRETAENKEAAESKEDAGSKETAESKKDDAQQGTAKETYLDTEALKNRKEPELTDLYQLYTLDYGTFTEKIKQKEMAQAVGGYYKNEAGSFSRMTIDISGVRYMLEGVKAQFGEYSALVSETGGGVYVDAGTPLATVYTDTDELDTMEAQRELERLQQRLQAAEEQMNQDLEDILEEKALIYNDYKRWIMDVRYEQRQRDWELEKFTFERQIEEAAEEVKKLQEAQGVVELKADKGGIPFFKFRYKYVGNYFEPTYTTTQFDTGDEVKPGDAVCYLQPGEYIIYQTPEGMDQLTYGMKMEVANSLGAMEGQVVSAGAQALYGNLNMGLSFVRVDIEEDPRSINSFVYSAGGALTDGTVTTVENVILVPKDAVTKEEDRYFVTVLREDGTLIRTEFIPGGKNEEEYWVLSGLSDGMQIIYN